MAAAFARGVEIDEKHRAVLEHLKRLSKDQGDTNEAIGNLTREVSEVRDEVREMRREQRPVPHRDMSGRSEDTLVDFDRFLKQREDSKDAALMRALKGRGSAIFWKIVGLVSVGFAALLGAALWSQVHR